MAIDLVSVLAGGCLGLIGGLGGVLLGHVLARRRDSATRSIEGLRLVINELNRFSQLGLFFEQQINIGLRDADLPTFAARAIQIPEWLKATHELQEANWRFPCMAYMPDTLNDFQEIDRLMLYVMDPYARQPSEKHEMNSDQAWEKFKVIHMRIQSSVKSRLKQLL